MNSSLTGRYRRQTIMGGYRRAVDPGNGITLTAVSDLAQINYSFQTTRNVLVGFSAYITRMDPLLQGSDRNSVFRSDGAQFNLNYRLNSVLHLTSSFGGQRVRYAELGFRQNRKAGTVGLAFSPGSLPLLR